MGIADPSGAAPALASQIAIIGGGPAGIATALTAAS